MQVKDLQIKTWTKYSIILGSLLLAALIITSPLGLAGDNFILDLYFLARGARSTPTEAVVVAIDEQSFAAIDHAWPWPREIHAKLLDKLSEAGARLTVFDVLFADHTDQVNDHFFAVALARHPEALLAASVAVEDDQTFLQQMIIRPSPGLNVSLKRQGIVNLSADADGFIRKYPLFYNTFPSLSLLAASRFTRRDIADFPAETKYLNLYGPSRTIKTISYYQALDYENCLPKEFFRNKLVFIGFSIKNKLDSKNIASDHYPVSFTRLTNEYMAGVELQATAACNLVNNSFLKVPSFTTIFSSGLVVAFIFGFLFFSCRPLTNIFFLVFATVTIALASLLLFIKFSFFLSPLPLLLPIFLVYGATSLTHYWKTSREKNFIRQVFSAYLAPSVVNQLLENHERLQLGGETVDASVLFTDFANFTPYAERVPSTVLISILNQYLGTYSDIVMQEKGMIVQYVGDALMATWGAPVSQKEHAVMCCRAALKISRATDELAERQDISEYGALRIRIGINSGSMIAGNVGGEKHQNYSILGNAVNLASRLEGLNKIYGTQIIIGHKTAEHVAPFFALRELDLVRVKGKTKVERIFELQCLLEDLLTAKKAQNKHFAIALQLYRKRDWDAAYQQFSQALLFDPADKSTQTMMQRCKIYTISPPPSGWHGILIMKNK